MSKAVGVIAVTFLATLPVHAEEITLVAYGDSLTQGYGLPSGDGFVPQLETWLTERGEDVRIINAGVSGDTTAGGAARIEWTLSEDVDAIIVTLGGNDLLRGIAPEVTRANLDKILGSIAERDIAALVVGMSATPNYGPDYKAAFDAIYPDLSAKYGMLYAEDFFLGFMEPDGSVDREAVRARMQGDGIHPNAEGVTDIVDALGPYVLQLLERARSAPQG